jgi:hypothetical protein
VKVASFTVRATMPQSVRWKQAAEGEGFASVGSWAGRALDAYLEARTRAGRPIPLAWHKGAVRVVLDGQEVTLKGWVSSPFGAFRGTAAGPLRMGCRRYTLVHMPARRIIPHSAASASATPWPLNSPRSLPGTNTAAPLP